MPQTWSQAFSDSTEELEGIIVTDADYLSKKDELKKLSAQLLPMYCNKEKYEAYNDKRAFSVAYSIENVWSVLKKKDFHSLTI